MKQRLETIQDQIHQCDKLLHVYQNEHRLLLSDDCSQLSDVAPIVEMKLRLMRTFNLQQQLISTLHCEHAAADADSRDLLRELARRIEQLLIIDRENEILLRQLLTSEKSRAARRRSPRPSPAEPRPAPSAPREAAHA